MAAARSPAQSPIWTVIGTTGLHAETGIVEVQPAFVEIEVDFNGKVRARQGKLPVIVVVRRESTRPIELNSNDGIG